MIKIRIGSEQKLHSFDSQDLAFKWVSDNFISCIVSVLRYDGTQLDSMERYMFNNNKFVKEQIRE